MSTWGCRQLKKEVLKLLEQTDVDAAMQAISQLPARQVVNPLFSFLYHREELIKWRSVTAMGIVVSKLAENNLESARIVMRRFMWNLNDESGGIGWGSPEAMGEIMAQHPGLAEEFHSILISYIRPDQNYLEHEILQRGVLWGIGRLAHARPHLMQSAASHLIPYLNAKDPFLRGTAAWAARAIEWETTPKALLGLAGDESTLVIYSNYAIKATTVGQLAAGDITAFCK
jgi:hypothetical protein